MSDWGEQENEDIISGAMKSRSGWAIFGNLVVHAWHCTGFFYDGKKEEKVWIFIIKFWRKLCIFDVLEY